MQNMLHKQPPDKADTTQEGQATEDKAADLQADLSADHPQEADHTIDAQEDTEAPHHTILIPLLPHNTS